MNAVTEEALLAGRGHGAAATPLKPEVKEFFDEPTFTVSYVVRDPASAACAIIDSVLHFDPDSGRTSVKRADEIIAFVGDNRLSVEWILETHVHADHLSAAPYLKVRVGGRTGIGANIVVVQKTFARIFNGSRILRPTAASSTTCSPTGNSSSSAICGVRPCTRRDTRRRA